MRTRTFRSGQTSTEYTILIAVLLLFLLFVIVPLFRVGSTSRSFEERSSTQYWLSADVAILESTFNGSALGLTLQNTQSDAITVTSIIVNNETVFTVNYQMNPGQINTTSLANPTAGIYQQGNTYAFPIVIRYTNMVTSGTYTFYGDVPVRGVVS